jgi:hypothetical protein
MQTDNDGASVKLEVFNGTAPLPTENGPLLTEVPLSPIPAPDNESTIAKHLRLVTAADPQVSEDFSRFLRAKNTRNLTDAEVVESYKFAIAFCDRWIKKEVTIGVSLRFFNFNFVNNSSTPTGRRCLLRSQEGHIRNA